ncbi:hypothetical protein [Methanosarcina sp.]|jgi:hypothetical protein|uniref:hypothetical protein n=1 Tax=Methanosarcina sp. TaxID=2213 RepID=UPI002BEEEFCA|nr:hypothetical protein [Methanosarcina sp.]HOW14621.1 hypothetical protein [Methanosarcina sp.]
MAKLAHLLVLSALIVWLAGSGCVGNNTSDIKEAGIAHNVAEAEYGISDNSEVGLTPAEVQELDGDMADLENLLNSSSAEEEIVLEDLQE